MKQLLRLMTCVCAITMLGFTASAQTTVTIYATGAAGSYNTGSVNSAGTKNDGNMITINSSTNRGWAKFDLSSIPAGALIVSANAVFTTYTSTASGAINNLYGFLGDPFSMSGTALYTACGSGTSFAAGTWTANATNTFALNATGTTFLQNNFGGLVDIGYVRGSTNTYNIYGYPGTTAQQPQLTITYNVPAACSGTPSPGATNANPATACPGGSVTVSLPSLPSASGYTFQWQSSPNSITWTNIPSATGATYTGTVSSATYFQCIVTCTNSGLSATSTPVLVNVGLTAACYCTSFATTTADEEIFNVTIGTLNNSSTCATVAPGAGSIAARYANYTSGPGIPATPSFAQGSLINSSITVSSCGTFNYTSGAAIFIDYNQDGDFLDAGEQVWNNGTSANINCIPQTIVPGSFTVPLSATPGITVMRIIDAEGYAGSTITPCLNTYGYGETEDYLVNIVAAVACSGTPSPGATNANPTSVCPNATTTLTLPSIPAATGYTYQWQSSPDGITWTNIPSATGASYTATLTVTTYYQCIVTCSNSSLSATSTPVMVTVGMSATCYCSSAATTTADEEIFNVKVSNLNNSSNCASVGTGPGSIATRYANYTSGPGAPAAIQLQQGYSYNDTITVSSCGTFNYTSGAAIFIDYNHDGDYLDAGEQVWNNGSAANINCVPASVVPGSFTVPITATTGTTFMRIIDAEGYAGTTITPCLSYGYGETEDYLVNILPAPPVDMGVSMLVQPFTSGCHTATDSVIVKIKNYSLTTIDFTTTPVTVNASVTGPNPMVFPGVVINTGTLAGGATMNVVIANSYNMTATGTYTFNASTTAVGDGNASNNAMPAVAINVSGGTATVSNANICAGSSVDLSLSGYTNGGSIQWESSTDNITFTPITGATTNPYTDMPSGMTYYHAVVCGLHTSIVDTVNTISVSAPTAINASRCGNGSITIGATASDSVNWFTGPTGGTSIHTGATYTTNVATTTTFYAENTFTSCGAGGMPVAPTCYPTYSSACSSSDYINNFSTTLGSTNISNLNSGCNGSGPSNTTFFPTQVVTCSPGASFNFSVQAGTAFGQGHRIWIDYNNDGDFTDPGEAVWASATSSTAVYTGTVTVPANTTPGPKRIRVMCRYATVPAVTDVCSSTLSFGEVEEYTLNVCTQCSSTRIPVVATVTAPPSITTTAGNTSLCGADTTLIAVSSSNSNYTYTWSPATALNSTVGDSVMFMPTAPGNYTYYVDAVDGSSGCNNRDTITLMMTTPPSVTGTVDVTPICSGSSVNLSGTQPPATVQITNSNVLNTTTTYPAPYGNWYGGARHQMMFRASELTAAGLTAGNLSGMTFQVTNRGTSDSLMNFTISIGTTALTDLSAGFASFSAIQVYTAPWYTPNVGTNTHLFSTPFYWDGVSNIIVETCFTNFTTYPSTYYTQNCVMRQSATSYVSTALNYGDNVPTICTNASTTTYSQRPNIAFIHSYSSWTYGWTPTASVATPNAQNTVATPPATTDYIVTVTDTVSGCTAMDTVHVDVNPSPAPMFGNDTAICSNTVLTLDGTAGPYTYLWNDNSTNQTLAVNSFGIYDVLVTDSVTGCTGTDTILVGINAAPSFSLGSDVTICAGNTVTFSGPSGQYHYMWNTTDTTQTVTVGAASNYELTVTDTINACFNSDTVALFVNPLPPVNLGSDTAICSASTPYVLTAPSGAYNYNWSDMSTNQTLNVTSTGTYYVVVTDNVTTCYSSDTVIVSVNTSPVVTLGNDTTFCSASGPITLMATAGPYNYLWNDMSTGMSLTTNTSGMYDVTVTDSISGCAAMDTVSITVNQSPVVNLGVDTSLCGGSLTLDAQNAGSNYMWSTTANTQTITVSSTGNYYVDVTSGAGCVATDSIMVTVNTPPTVTFNPQTPVCVDDGSFTLTGSPTGGTFTGLGVVSGNMFSPSVAGVGPHTVTYSYTDGNGCFGSFDAVITVNACTGVNEPFVAAGMNVYPNPNNGSFTLTINDADYTDVTMELVTIEGQVIYSDKASNVKGVYVKQLDLSAHANGIYFLRVTADGQSYMQKIVKQD
jgi:hypothetical protein